MRVGASLSLTGPYAALGQNQHRGYQLCLRHENDRGGVLGRRLELVLHDDRSEPATAAGLYDRLITRDRVDLVIGPYSSPILDAVADVTEKHRMPLVAPQGTATSIWRKGRKFIFMVQAAAEAYLEGVVDIAARRGLRTLAVVGEDTLFARAVGQGTIELARRKGLDVVLVHAYPKGTTDFAAILTRAREANPDVLAAATYFDDAVAITRQLKALDVNPRMYGVTVGGDLPRFSQVLGRSADFVYGASQWLPELVALRAGGLVPIARQYPGAAEFVEAHRKGFPNADISYHTASGYGGCQILLEAVRRAGSLSGEKIRGEILKLDVHTVFGAFKVDQDGFQVAHKMVTFQWQDGKKVVVWPTELAPGQPRFPTPPWSHRP
jgi:branched-chain amino acid transport system substrate-binding protein